MLVRVEPEMRNLEGHFVGAVGRNYESSTLNWISSGIPCCKKSIDPVKFFFRFHFGKVLISAKISGEKKEELLN